MADPEFSFTENAVPVVQLGLGDTRLPTGLGLWDSALWDDATALWEGTEPSWWDVSCYAHQAEINRGRERTTDRFLPGTASVTFDNRDGWADMAGSPGTIAAVSLRPGRQIRVGVDVASIGIQWLFRGVIDRVTPAYDPVREDIVTLDCIDMLGEVGSTKLIESPPVGADDTFTERVNRLLDTCGWPADKRLLAPSTLRLIQSTYGAQAIDLLGVAADSVGGIIYGDELGNIVTKNYGWQAYEEDDQPDGSIGNIIEGTPAVPAHTPDAYLEAPSTVSTPDAPSLTLPNAFTVFVKTRVPVGGITGAMFLAGQWTAGNLEWEITRHPTTGIWFLGLSTNGTSVATTTPFSSIITPPTGADETWALCATLDNGIGQSELRAFRLFSGTDLEPVWRPASDIVVGDVLTRVERSSAVTIGSTAWSGRIYAVELATNAAPAPKGATIWRAEINDQPHTSTPTYAVIGTSVEGISTPDRTEYNLAGDFEIIARLAKTVLASGTDATIVAQGNALPQLAWILYVTAAGELAFSFSANGNGYAFTRGLFTLGDNGVVAGEEFYVRVSFDRSVDTVTLQAYMSPDGLTWEEVGPPQPITTTLAIFNSTDPIRVGTRNALRWDGRIELVEMHNFDGALLWRFDPTEWTSGTSYTDGRGLVWSLHDSTITPASETTAASWTDVRARTWTVNGTVADTIHPAPAPAVVGTPGDICPSGWEVSFDRLDIATQIELNRQLPDPPPSITYNLSSSVALPPAANQIRLNSTDQVATTHMYIDVTSLEGTPMSPFLRNLIAFSEVKISDNTDTENQTRTYRVTGNAVLDSGGTFWSIPIAWIDGEVGVGGQVRLQLHIDAPLPYVADDEIGQLLYGIETVSLTDLIPINGAIFPDLAERALITRGYTSMPRLEAVTLDAKASHGAMATLELMARCRPENPSRYICRLRHESGRMIFDRNMFAVSTRHFIASDEWTLRVGLDDAYGQMHHVLWDSGAVWDAPTLDLWS